MDYLKFRADKIFTGREFLDKNKVLITDEKGMIENIVDEEEAGDDMQVFRGILTPGFINCHCHLELSHLKGLIPERTGLVDFVWNILQLRHFPEEEILAAIELAENEMLKNGIVATGDICNTTFSARQKSQNNLHYYNFIEVSGFMPQFAEKRFKQAVEVSAQLEAISHRSSSIVPHAAYSVSEELFQLINQSSEGKICTIHNQETHEENKFFQTGESDLKRIYQLLNVDISFHRPSGISSLQTYLPLLKDVSSLILVHNTFTSEEDLKFMNQESLAGNQIFYWCLCPNANLYIENALPPIDLFRQYQCAIVLGTDSLASNYGLSVLDEMKTIMEHYPALSQSEVMRWATLNGAEALKIADTFGSLKQGKRPGILCIDENFRSVKRLV